MKAIRVLVGTLAFIGAIAVIVGAVAAIYFFLEWSIGWDHFQVYSAVMAACVIYILILGGLAVTEEGQRWPWEPKR